MFILVDGKDTSYVNTDFIQCIIGKQVQMADGRVFTLKDDKSIEEALKEDPLIKALNNISENVKSDKPTTGGSIFNG